MNKSIFFLGLLLLTTVLANAQDAPRTEEYALLELSTRCSKSNLSITDNAGGTTLSEEYNSKQSILTDDERLLIAMNEMNAKGFKLKSTIVVADKCTFKKAFLFYKSRPAALPLASKQ
ncbi:MAG: hypothetical protein AB8F78_18995 [Saprospiraceae bacterium]